jgi:hypothetical protein
MEHFYFNQRSEIESWMQKNVNRIKHLTAYIYDRESLDSNEINNYFYKHSERYVLIIQENIGNTLTMKELEELGEFITVH